MKKTLLVVTTTLLIVGCGKSAEETKKAHDNDMLRQALSGSCDRILSPAEVARGENCKTPKQENK